MTQTLNVGLVGYGMASKTFHAPLIEATPTLELTAVVSGDADKVKADLPSVEVLPKAAMLFARADIDLVVIVTPNDTHFALAKAALGAGKHVVVDKPVTITLSESRLLKSLATNAQCMLSVFHNRRWDSDFLALQEVIAAGELGRVASLESRFDRFRPMVPADRWRERHQPGSGIWYDLGPHLLDQAVLLFGMPKAVFVELSALRDGAQVDDDFLAMLAYDHKRVVLQAGTLAAEETPRFRVNGTRGSFVKFGLDPQESWLKEGRRPTPEWGVDPWPGRLTLENGEAGFIERRAPSPPGDYLAYYAGIASTLLEGTPPPVSVDEAIAVMTLLEVGLDSHRQKRWINLK